MASIELHKVDVKAFISVIDTCEGDVFLVTDEGDRLNLKSKLCQLIGLTQLIEGGKISNAHLECANPDDLSKLFRFNIFGADSNTKEEESKPEEKKDADKD